MHPQKFTSSPTEGQTFHWSIYDSWWQHQMSVDALRHDRSSGQFSKSWGLSASVSLPFLPTPSPLLLLAPFFAWSFTLVPHSLLWNHMETLAKQATRCQEFLAKEKFETGSKKVQSCLPYYRNTCHFVVTKRITLPLILCYYCWFARDVTVAMLVVKNKSISLLWELNSIFM